MQLREDAVSIWQAGLSAVDSSAAVSRVIVNDDDWLEIAGQRFAATETGRLEVLGAGKAGAGMAAGFEAALAGTAWFERLSGWVNVPEDCLLPLQHIRLHPARPPGRNEPTPAVVAGTEEILRRASSLSSEDVCVVLLSGGASALLCSPAPGITLQDKLEVTRLLSASGAPIQELNLVRTQLSRVKGGGLAELVSSDRLIVLVISDVIGDPLEVIGSGPAVATPSRRPEAVEILRQRQLWERVPASVRAWLTQPRESIPRSGAARSGRVRLPANLHHRIVASNAMALEAAAAHATELGYQLVPILRNLQGEAAVAGRAFGEHLAELSRSSGRWCLLGGGETTVNLASGGEPPGSGGRNQEFVLAAAAAAPNPDDWLGKVLLSGGTDGEDGPTPAAGAICDSSVLDAAATQGLDLSTFLLRHDSCSLFRQTDGLLITGPTQTNVMDLVVGLVDSSGYFTGGR
ncbi:MAG: putative hydroxypyruvate reductase [Planctomycetota bacterium]|jgi:glycerate-2-kinase